jgi:hypothetical protein
MATADEEIRLGILRDQRMRGQQDGNREYEQGQSLRHVVLQLRLQPYERLGARKDGAPVRSSQQRN